MTSLRSVLEELKRDLDARGQRWALVGGFAVSARTEARFTRDVDCAVSVGNDAEAEALVAGLVVRGYLPFATVEQTDAHRLATVRFVPPGGSSEGPIADLLFASSGIEPEVVAAAE